MNELREALAETAHISWSGWTLYLLQKDGVQPDGSVLLPASYVAALEKQALTGYAFLSEEEKALDRREADNVLDTLRLDGINRLRAEASWLIELLENAGYVIGKQISYDDFYESYQINPPDVGEVAALLGQALGKAARKQE